MRAVEALEAVIAEANKTLMLNGTYGSDAPELSEEENRLAVATSICQAMLNTAIPIARWRLHIEIEEVERKSRLKVCDYTVCSTHTTALQSSLIGLFTHDARVSITLWEQKQSGAEMTVGYRGQTKDQRFRRFLDQLQYFQVEPTVQ